MSDLLYLRGHQELGHNVSVRSLNGALKIFGRRQSERIQLFHKFSPVRLVAAKAHTLPASLENPQRLYCAKKRHTA